MQHIADKPEEKGKKTGRRYLKMNMLEEDGRK
jgi:hypothetical protein